MPHFPIPVRWRLSYSRLGLYPPSKLSSRIDYITSLKPEVCRMQCFIRDRALIENHSGTTELKRTESILTIINIINSPDSKIQKKVGACRPKRVKDAECCPNTAAFTRTIDYISLCHASKLGMSKAIKWKGYHGNLTLLRNIGAETAATESVKSATAI